MEAEKPSKLSRSDAKMIIAAANNRWNISPEMKQKWIDLLNESLSQKCSAREKAAYLRCLVAMEGQNQADALQAEKNKRLDEGLPTEQTTIKVSIPKPREDFQIE